MRIKEESDKVGLKFKLKKTKIRHPVPSLMADRKGKGSSSDRVPLLGL